jgi:hypothetical protein
MMMAEFIRGNGSVTINMERDGRSLVITPLTLVTMLMVNRKESANIPGLMENSTKENGLME